MTDWFFARRLRASSHDSCVPVLRVVAYIEAHFPRRVFARGWFLLLHTTPMTSAGCGFFCEGGSCVDSNPACPSQVTAAPFTPLEPPPPVQQLMNNGRLALLSRKILLY